MLKYVVHVLPKLHAAPDLFPHYVIKRLVNYFIILSLVSTFLLYRVSILLILFVFAIAPCD